MGTTADEERDLRVAIIDTAQLWLRWREEGVAVGRRIALAQRIRRALPGEVELARGLWRIMQSQRLVGITDDEIADSVRRARDIMAFACADLSSERPGR